MRLSQDRLADIAELSKPTIIAVERGQGNIRSLAAIMTALGLPALLRPAEQSEGCAGSRPISIRIHEGDCLNLLDTLPSNAFQTCVTSPPYYQQRDYGVVGQIGLEPSPDEYLERLVAVFRKVRRVLRKDGTLWLNIGDAFAKSSLPGSHKRKDLLAIPWKLALALRDDGWYLRQDIVIHKSNPLPEPVTDRCVRAHEYLFLFSKSRQYCFDAEALRERGKTVHAGSAQRDTRQTHGLVSGGNTGLNAAKQRMREELEENGFVTRNRRSVWEVTSRPSKDGHFAAFPEVLVETCLLASCPEGGSVLDPFGGSGTTGRVAHRMNRNAELIEINPRYVEMARRRSTVIRRAGN